MVGANTRNNLAAVSANGTINSWNPLADASVEVLISDGSGNFYAGGNFTCIGDVVGACSGGTARAYAAKILANSQVDAGWSADVTPFGGFAPVLDMEIAGGQLYIAGDYTDVNAIPRENLARVSLSDGAVDVTWDPSPNNVVFSLGSYNNYIVAGGDFDFIAGAMRTMVAVFDISGSLDNWSFGFHPTENNWFHHLTVTDGTIFVSSHYDDIASPSGSITVISALDFSAQQLFPWPEIYGMYVYGILADSGQIYVGGNFSVVNGRSRNNLAGLSDSGELIW